MYLKRPKKAEEVFEIWKIRRQLCVTPGPRLQPALGEKCYKGLGLLKIWNPRNLTDYYYI